MSNWIQGADIKKGAFRAKAKAAGMMTKTNTVKPSFIAKELHSKNPKTKKQAVLAKNFSKMRRG